MKIPSFIQGQLEGINYNIWKYWLNQKTDEFFNKQCLSVICLFWIVLWIVLFILKSVLILTSRINSKILHLNWVHWNTYLFLQWEFPWLYLHFSDQQFSSQEKSIFNVKITGLKKKKTLRIVLKMAISIPYLKFLFFWFFS